MSKARTRTRSNANDRPDSNINAVAASTRSAKKADADSAAVPSKAASGMARPPSKTSLLIEALSQPDGATIEALCSVTGWQSHSVRAALTALRKKGHEIARTKTDSRSVYAIAGTPAEAAK